MLFIIIKNICYSLRLIFSVSISLISPLNIFIIFCSLMDLTLVYSCYSKFLNYIMKSFIGALSVFKSRGLELDISHMELFLMCPRGRVLQFYFKLFSGSLILLSCIFLFYSFIINNVSFTFQEIL